MKRGSIRNRLPNRRKRLILRCNKYEEFVYYKGVPQMNGRRVKGDDYGSCDKPKHR